MKTQTPSKRKFQNLLRQGMNWWLGYVLSQPVDIDISVLFRFVSAYAGLPFVYSLSNIVRSVIPIPVKINSQEKAIEMVIDPESYSTRL